MVKIISWITTGVTELKENLNQVFFDKSQSYKVKIPAIFLFSLGVLLILISLDLNDQNPNNIDIGIIGIMLFFMGIFIFLFFSEERSQNNNENYIFLFLTGWLIIMSLFSITFSSRLNFFLFIVFGILICREFASGYVTPLLKKKLSILTLVFFSMSMMLIAEKILNILTYI